MQILEYRRHVPRVIRVIVLAALVAARSTGERIEHQWQQAHHALGVAALAHEHRGYAEHVVEVEARRLALLALVGRVIVGSLGLLGTEGRQATDEVADQGHVDTATAAAATAAGTAPTSGTVAGHQAAQARDYLAQAVGLVAHLLVDRSLIGVD